ncbi:MAG: hypothetical protein RLZZ585_399 [Bacteroidota bacterium]|jgi:hypothetical protein
MSRLLLLFLLGSFSSWSQPLMIKDSLFPEYKKVMIYSAVIPGAGQVYNSIHRENGPKHAYWKVPLIYAALGATGYFLTVNNQTQKSLKTEYTNRINNAGSLNPTWAPYDDQAVLSLYQSYLNKRDMSILGCAAVYFIQIAEAGVEAHFLHFDVTDKLSLQATPTLFGPSSAGIHIKLQFR